MENGNQGTFISLIKVAGAMRWDAYTGIGDVAISLLRSSPKWPPRTPDVSRLVPGFEGPIGWGDNYGARIIGFVTRPSSGSTSFHIAADDNAELWLSTDDSPQNARIIATEPVWANTREWTGDAGGNREGCANGDWETT